MEDAWARHATGSCWQTADEHAFLDHRGTYAARQGDRATLLRRYRVAIGHRAPWGAVDDGVVRAHVEALRTQEGRHA